MTHDFDSFKLKKLHTHEEHEVTGKKDTLDRAISGFMDDFVEKCVNDKDNLHIRGEDVCLFLKELWSRAGDEAGKDEKVDSKVLSDLGLFYQVEYYYRFHIHNRQYQSFRVEFAGQKPSDTTDELYGKLKDLIEDTSDIKKDKKNNADAFSLYSTLIKHLYQVTKSGNKQHEQFEKHEQGYWKSGYVPLNDYHKSELLTWNRLLKKDNQYRHSVYPFCKFEPLEGQDRLILLIVTKLDLNYVDTKVKKVDKIEPAHMIIFKSPELTKLSREKLANIEFKLRHVLGYLSYAVFAGRTDESLESMSNEAALVSRHWYSDGIETLFKQDEEGSSLKGMDFSKKFIEEILCADVEGLKNLEVFPFDRVYVFFGSSFKAIEPDPGTKRRTNKPMKLMVLEAALKSKRPQDNDLFLSCMERLEKISEDVSEQPNLAIFFDVTKKKIVYQSACTIQPGTKWAFSINDESGNVQQEFEEKIDDLERYNEKIEDGVKLGEKEKIDAVINSLFTGFKEMDDSQLQKFCQQTYQYYDTDGLCFLTDFAVKVGELKSLKLLQGIYLETFFKKQKKEWGRIWRDNPANIPNIEEFKEWLKDSESKIVLVSFDPNQNLDNIDSDGNRYLEEKDAFTMILVADEDVGKNNYDQSAEVLDLEQMFKMVISRKLREAIMTKEVLRGQKKLFSTVMPTIMHQTKHLLAGTGKEKEVSKMMDNFKALFEAEDFSAQYRDMESTQTVYEYFLGPFITDQLGETLEAKNVRHVENKMAEACRTYRKKIAKSREDGSSDAAPFDCIVNKKYFPKFQIRLKDEFVHEACKILINNAVEHANLYTEESGKNPEIIISFNLYPNPADNMHWFEFSIVNNSRLEQDKLEDLNAPEPKEAGKDDKKSASSGKGLFMARIQLQKSIGKGADIKISNVGPEYVEAKLILPARLMQEQKLEVKTDTSPADEKENYILYVEDDPEYQENSKKAIENILGNDYKLFVYDNKKDAVTKIRETFPSMILMDTAILRVPGESEAAVSHGQEVLKALNHIKKKPPVIMLSNYEPEDIEEMILECNLLEYEIQIIDFKKIKKIKEKTVIIPLESIKDISGHKGKSLREAIKNWKTENINRKRKKKSPPTQLPEAPAAGLKYVEVDFNDKDFDKKLEHYRKRNIRTKIPDEIFIARAKVDDEKTFFETLLKWFSHKGLKSFFKDEQNMEEYYPLVKNEQFQTLFLNVQITGKLTEFVDMKVRYWGLPRNILISGRHIKIDPILAWQWKHTPHGVKGTLSNLRHNIKNKIKGNELKILIAAIDKVEEQLAFTDREFQSDLNTLLKDRDERFIDKLKSSGAKLTLTVHEVFKEMNAVFAEHLSNPAIEKFFKVLQGLQDLLGK